MRWCCWSPVDSGAPIVRSVILQKTMMRKIIQFAALMLALVLAGTNGWAQTEPAKDEIKQASRQLDAIERALARPVWSQRITGKWLKQLNEAESVGSSCVEKTEQQIKQIEESIASLGPLARKEPLDVTRKRNELKRQKGELEKKLASCRLLVVRSDQAQQRVAEIQKKILAERLFARGPNLLRLLKENWDQPAVWITGSRDFLLRHSGIGQLSGPGLIWLIVVLLVAFGISLVGRRHLSAWTGRRYWSDDFSSRFFYGVAVTSANYLPQLLVSGSVAVFLFILFYDVRPIPFINVVAYGLAVSFLLVALLHLFLLSPAPGSALVPLEQLLAKALARRLKVLVLLIFVGYLFFATILTQSLPEPALLMARAIFVAVFILNLMWALLILGRVPRLARMRRLLYGIHVILVATVIAEWVGYRNLSAAIFRTLFGTLVILGVVVLIGKLIGDLVYGLEHGRSAWHRRFRSWLRLKPEDSVPGLMWIHAIAVIALWVSGILAAMRVWGVSEATFEQLKEYFIKGFTIGSLHLLPARILLALLTFALLVALTGWLRGHLERRWIKQMRMDRGSREALVTVSGYIGVAVAVLVALGVAGITFSNVAIIAGALSVGIGFGLQNIVNNFVSGLILLFERPIKTGDWIVVGNTEGYVKRIRIRSTQIQTFDRADVIVPNSELISGQVTNWMLYDLRGRVRVPVGVAYGTDTAKVKQALLEVANQHPLVISNDPQREPNVLFMAFGDSSLDFELRCHIQNIDQRRQVISDLNFAIDAAFRENNIEIPFPQRDIHIRETAAPVKLQPPESRMTRGTPEGDGDE